MWFIGVEVEPETNAPPPKNNPGSAPDRELQILRRGRLQGWDFLNTREIKIHVYSIRQTANVSGEFLRIENKQLKKVQNDSCGQNYHKTTYFCVEAINGKRKIGGKLGHVVQIHVWRLA